MIFFTCLLSIKILISISLLPSFIPIPVAMVIPAVFPIIVKFLDPISLKPLIRF